MITSYRRYRAAAFILAVAAVACTRADQPEDTDDTDSVTASATDFRARKAFIDSVVKTAPTMSAVIKEKGSIYSEADAALTAAVHREAEKTRDCYTKTGLGYDPQLTGVAYVVVHFGAAGWDLIRVEQAQWSSPAGNAVKACIDARAKTEWKLPMTGVKPGAHLVALTFRPDSSGPTAR